MPSAMLAKCLDDPDYNFALAKLGDRGFSRNDTVTYGGKIYTHDEIAGMFDEAYQRHRGEYCQVMGGKPRVQKKRKRAFKAAVRDDVYSSFHLSWLTILMAGVMFVLAGPMGLVIAICAALFEYYFLADWTGEKAMLTAMGCA